MSFLLILTPQKANDSHYIAWDQALLFGWAKQASRQRVSEGLRRRELVTISHKFSFPPQKPRDHLLSSKFRQPRGCGIIDLYKSLSQQHQSSVFNHWYAFFFHGDIKLQCSRIRTQYFDSCFIYFWKVLLCRGLLPFAITNKNIGYLSVTELKNSVFPNLVLLSCTPVATNSFSCPSLRWSYTVKYMFLPSGIQLGEETNVGRQRLNRALESLFTFTLLVFRTKQDAWHKQIQL